MTEILKIDIQEKKIYDVHYRKLLYEFSKLKKKKEYFHHEAQKSPFRIIKK